MNRKAPSKRKAQASKKASKKPARNRRALLLVVLVIAVGAIAIPTIRSLSPSRSPAAAPVTVPAATLALGEDIFRANCAVCHGAEGQGHVRLNAPALNGSEHSWHHPDEQIIQLIRNGGSVMPAVGASWSDGDIEAVISYFKQWWSVQQRTSQRGTIGE